MDSSAGDGGDFVRTAMAHQEQLLALLRRMLNVLVHVQELRTAGEYEDSPRWAEWDKEIAAVLATAVALLDRDKRCDCLTAGE